MGTEERQRMSRPFPESKRRYSIEQGVKKGWNGREERVDCLDPIGTVKGEL